LHNTIVGAAAKKCSAGFPPAVRVGFILYLFLFASVVWAGEVYHHPTGLTFVPPDGWNIRDSRFTDFELVPPDPSSNDKGPTESYFLLTLGVAASSAQDPQLLQSVDSLMSQIAPFLKKTGEMEPSNSGALQKWEGKSPSGPDVLAAVYVLPSAQVSYVQISLGEKERIVSRQQTLHDLYANFQPGEGSREPALIGNWSVSTTGENQEKLESSIRFDADGVFRAVQSSGQQKETVNGRWYARSGKLFLVPENTPSINLRYEIAGNPETRTVKLIHGNGEVEEMQEGVSETISRAPD